MNGLLAHDVKQWFCLGKTCVRATGHEGERARCRPADPAGYRGVHGQQSRSFGIRCHCAGAVYVHGGTIHQRCAGGHGRDHLCCHGPQDGAIGQHGDDHVRACCRLCGAGGFGDAVYGHVHRIKSGDFMPRRNQVGRHRRPHVAQSDKSDLHLVPLRMSVRPRPAVPASR